MADPGFPRGGGAKPPGAPNLQGAPTYGFAKFPQNCMKLKEFGPGGGRPKFYYVDTPLVSPLKEHTFASVRQ